MLHALFLLTVLFVSNPLPNDTTIVANAMQKPHACQFFTNENAAKIIGGKVRADDEGMIDDEKTKKWKCTFSAAAGGNGPKVYFMLMRSSLETAAKDEFEVIGESNKNHAGFEEWPGTGDEAVVHTDGSNFQFVMIRKGAITIRVKVNPARGVSLENLKTVAASLVPRMN